MTEADALTMMKRQCKILSQALTDTELIGFLNDNSKDDGTGTGTLLYNMNKAIYNALSSAITVLPSTFSRGGVSSTSNDLNNTLKDWQRRAAVGNSDFPGVGIGVLIRDIPRHREREY